MPIPWNYNDGGRAATGIRGGRGDRVCRAVAIATGKPYREVFDLIVDYAATSGPPNVTVDRATRSPACILL